jgi:CheY-like chemotaxis protein
VFIGALAPAGAAWHLQRPIDPNRILRALDELTAREVASSVSPTPEAPTPGDPDAALIDDDMPIVDEAITQNADAANPAKAAARAAARRARLASARAAPRKVDPPTDVLVLDGDEEASASLCTLLERFGFSAYSVRTIEKTIDQLATRHYAAIFLDIVLDSAGLSLLEKIQALAVPQGQSPAAVLLVTASLDPTDRVRAALAGIGAPLIKPLSRGTVARALEDRKVTLPADARRV